MSPKWTPADIPDVSGKVFVISGANSGLGYHSALELARKGARVVMACRSLDKGTAARDEILQRAPEASLDLMQLDLASLASIRQFAAAFKDSHTRLDVLMNNAGVMATPRMTTADGFELQIGTNHLGHFALSGLLIERLLDTPGSRVVTTYSMAEEIGRINFDSFRPAGSYSRWVAYCQSKLANMLFAQELQRKLGAANAHTISLAAHPGISHTNLQVSGLQTGGSAPFQAWLWRWLRDSFFQPAEIGALPQLQAATSPDARGGECYGPGGFLQLRGYPKAVRPFNPSWRNAELARRLWQVSEELTGVYFAI